MPLSTRRAFCRNLAVATSGLAFTQAQRPPAPSVNVVYILADDLGFGDVRFLNPDRCKLATPNIDRLSTQGMTFLNAHSGSAVCTPTRYGILTGRYSWRSKLQTGVLQPYGTPLIPPDRLTVPSMLRSRGYATACVGKWHLGWDWPKENGKIAFDRPILNGPTAIGFDHYFGTDVPNYPPYCFIQDNRTVGIPSAEKPRSRYGNTDGVMVPGWRLDEILPTPVEKASGFITRQAASKHPFFLYLPLTSPHTPLAVADDWKGKSGLGLYGDWVMQTDWAVRRILRTLEESETDRNTLVVFTSDNGCAPYIGVDYDTEHDKMGRVMELEENGHYPSANFRGYKSDIWEGGHHIPFVVRWPGVVKPGSRCEEIVCLTDLIATLAEVLDYELPHNAAEDSVSFLPALRGTAIGPLREATVHHSLYGKFAIRQGKWKLELCSGSGGWSHPSDQEASASGEPGIQLYDMVADPAEKVNLQKRYPEVVKKLNALLARYVAEGRSTPGPSRQNDVEVDIWKKTAGYGKTLADD